jgi:hypothetical protein
MRIELSDADLEQLMRPIRGQGGWQSLVRRLQRQVAGNVVELSEYDQQSILHYLLSYGTGGWQGRIAGIAGMSRSASKRAKRKTRRRSEVVTG